MEQVQTAYKPIPVSEVHGNEAQEAFLPSDASAHSSQQPAKGSTESIRTSKRRQRWNQRLKNPFEKGWTLEACSCVFAVLSLVGLALTLWAHGEKPLPEWPQLVSLNSILSIFALLMRTSLGLVLAEGISQMKWQWFRMPQKLVDMQHFDSANRGSWGSFMFLYHLGWKRKAWIATFGALVTVTTPLIGFFVQQSLEFDDCLRRDSSVVPLLAKKNSYEFSGPVAGPMNSAISNELIVAINAGIIQPVDDRTNVLSQHCATGNCTFPVDNGASLSTVAVTHECVDISSELVQIGNLTGSSWMFNLTYGGTEYSPPINISLSGVPTVLATGVDLNTEAISTVKMIFRSDYDDFNVTVVSCSILPAVNTYGANITDTRLREILIESVPMGKNYLPAGSNVTSRLDMNNEAVFIPIRRVTRETIRNGKRVKCHRQETPAPGLFAVANINIDAAPGVVNVTDEDTKLWYTEPDCVWGIRKDAAENIEDYMSEIFANEEMGVSSRLWGPGTGSVYLRRLFLEGNITVESMDEAFKNLTDSINALIRTNGNPNYTTYAEGDMWYTTTCVYVNWSWISYPAISIFMSIVFLVLVGVETRHVESQRLWKSSVLATLFCDVGELGVMPAERKEMHSIAKSTSAGLNTEGTRMRLIVK